MRVQGKDLIFVNKIQGFGGFIIGISGKYLEALQNEVFELKPLSVAHGTYIAFNSAVFIVQLKEDYTEINQCEFCKFKDTCRFISENTRNSCKFFIKDEN